MIALEIAPAIILINMKSINDIDSKLNIIQKILARIAKNKDNIIVKTKADMILLFNCSDNSNFGEIIPICKFVESLDANDPKIFPLIPIAPGIITSSPGKALRKNVMFPKIIPANKSPNAQINKAIKLSLIIELCSVIKSVIEDSEVRIFFFFVFMHITTHYHFYHIS